MKWYYSKNGSQQGPVDEPEIRAKIAAGEITNTSLVWREGMIDWLPLSKVPEFAATAPVATTLSPTASYQAPASQDVIPPVHVVPIPNYLWQSIAVTILCCWPFGIPAIVFAAKVDGLVARGDIAGAMDASKKAKMWCLIAVGAFVVTLTIAFAMGLIGAVSASPNAY